MVDVQVKGVVNEDWAQYKMAIGITLGEGRSTGRAPEVRTLYAAKNGACLECKDNVVTLAAVCGGCRKVHRCMCGKVTFLADQSCRTCVRKRVVCDCLALGGIEKWKALCLKCLNVSDPAYVPPATTCPLWLSS